MREPQTVRETPWARWGRRAVTIPIYLSLGISSLGLLPLTVLVASAIDGIRRTGRLVTCAALILFFAFSALAASPGTDIKVIATALGVGILLDATVVRALLVPALVSLFGPYNWYLPNWAARVLRVEPSPLRPERDVVVLLGPGEGPGTGKSGGDEGERELVESGERG